MWIFIFCNLVLGLINRILDFINTKLSNYYYGEVKKEEIEEQREELENELRFTPRPIAIFFNELFNIQLEKGILGEFKKLILESIPLVNLFAMYYYINNIYSMVTDEWEEE